MTEDRPAAGLFGKLPLQGDFVERGLPPAFRRQWDMWITRHIAPRQRGGALFPGGGLRFRLVSGGATAAGLILPGGDSAGRLFPLSLLLIADGALAAAAIDRWCDDALVLPLADLDADALWLALDGLTVPEITGPAGPPALDLWAGGGLPEGFSDTADGAALLQRLLPV